MSSGCRCTTDCSSWTRLLPAVAVAVVYSTVLLVLLPLMIYGLYVFNAEATVYTWFIGGVFIALSLPIFTVNLLQHLYNYTRPHLQAYIVRVLWIVPVYSINSWLGLRFPSTAIYWSTMRECYESYALYNFLTYVLNFMEREYNLAEVMDSRPPVKHPIPVCMLRPWSRGRGYIRWCKVGVMQYAVLRPVLTILALISQLAGVYDNGHFRLDRTFVYIIVVNSMSQGSALYCLAYFYKGTRDLLKPISPLLKFAAIKLIVVFTFWQSIIVSVLVKTDVIKQSKWEKYGFQDVSVSLQDFVICMEMLVAAVAFYFIFSHKPYVNPAAPRPPCLASCLKMVDVRDLAVDVKENFIKSVSTFVQYLVWFMGCREQEGQVTVELCGVVEQSEDEDEEEGSLCIEHVPLLRINDSERDKGSDREEPRITGIENEKESLSVQENSLLHGSSTCSEMSVDSHEHEYISA